MGLAIPNLDTKDFKIRMEEALAKLPAYADRWTDHNPSDPGITIIELLAWMADINSYRLNRVRDEHYLAFLKLLGTELKYSQNPNKILNKTTIGLGKSNGYSKQRFRLRDDIDIDSIVLKINDISWYKSDEMFSAMPDDMVYSIENRSILFGDGAYGKIPEYEHKIEIECYIYSLEDESGSSHLESIDEAFMRIREENTLPCRAVTLKDYEYLALQTPNTDLARAKATVDKENNKVSIMVIPHSKKKEPQPDQQTKKTVRRYLNQKRLLTTRINIIEKVNYVPVNVTLKIKTRHGDPIVLKESIHTLLEEYFHPLYGGKEGRGWEFGEDIHISNIYMLLNEVKGIEKIDHVYLSSTVEKEISISIDENVLPVSGLHNIDVQSITDLGSCL